MLHAGSAAQHTGDGSNNQKDVSPSKILNDGTANHRPNNRSSKRWQDHHIHRLSADT
jgi:hypothetical protein